jgi:ion channel
LFAGIALVALVLFDVFETVIVPRRSASPIRLSPHITVFLWPAWRRFGVRIRTGWRREDFLGTFAPFLIVLVLVVWVLSLILGFGIILHALADQIDPTPPDFETALYLAGTSLLTIGFGDYVPVGMAARAAALLAGASGLAVLALVISLTFNLYASFARREVLVLLLDSRAGVPPSGVMLLETFGRYRIVDDLAPMFAQYEVWTADMLDSHLAYSILPFFRSSHDGQSWVSALGAVLDAATLLITTVRDEASCDAVGLRKSRAAAEMMYEIGCHALMDLTHGRLARRYIDPADRQPGIERPEFETACRQLAEVGYPTDCSDESWRAFAEHRGVYAARLNLLARYFASPPTQWIGDRTVLAHLHHHEHLGP